MEKLNFVKDGALKLPPGFRFQPTEEEIVFQYLARKITSSPLPASVIPDIPNICNYQPWNLPGDMEEDRYFFSKKLEGRYGNGNRRGSVGGYWKATGLDKHIMCPTTRSTTIMGMRKTLVFYRGKSSRTDWIMHEYRLVQSQNNQNGLKQVGDWVICHIFSKDQGNVETEDADDVIVLPTSSSSSSSYGSDLQETSSSAYNYM